MLMPYWDYFIERNWNYNLYAEAIHSNIFCYGKPKSRRTESVALPIAMAAIQEGRSCIICAKNAKAEYHDLLELAQNKEYDIIIEDASELPEDESIYLANEIIDSIIFRIPTLVLINDNTLKAPDRSSPIDKILNSFYQYREILQAQQTDRQGHLPSSYRADSTLIVLDDLNGNEVIRSTLPKKTYLQFCVITDSQVAYIPWLQGKIRSVLEDEKTKVDVPDQLQDLLPTVLAHRFFAGFETIICTGVNGVKPEMHKHFVGHYLFAEPPARIGGRFIIMEYPPEDTRKGELFHTRGGDKNIVVTQENIETSAYSEISDSIIEQDGWVLEHNGKIMLHADKGIYFPIVFQGKSAALNWLSKLARKNNEHVLDLEQDNTMARVVIGNADETREYYLTCITKQEEEQYRTAYLLRVLEVMEQNELIAWLQTPEATEQGYDPTAGVAANLEKYYATLEREMDDGQAEEEDTIEAAEPKLLPEVEPYWEKYQSEKTGSLLASGHSASEENALPTKGVLFLGGHWNMVKKLRQIHPTWEFITDDRFKNANMINAEYVFYWTNHSSHKLMENIFSKLTTRAKIFYVTATNMNRLENEMLEKYRDFQRREQTTENK